MYDYNQYFEKSKLRTRVSALMVCHGETMEEVEAVENVDPVRARRGGSKKYEVGADIEPKEGWFHRTFPKVRWVPTSPTRLREAEEKLLSYVPVNSVGRYVDVGTLNGDPCRIWTRQFGDLDPRPGGPLPLVMLHGMASGIALFCLNFKGLVEGGRRPIYAIDLPGFARSSRPRFSSKHEEAEEQFVIAIEEWRKKVGLDRICLMGHSFGGYLAASYALKHPEKLGHLILVDPWGFPAEPKEVVQRRNIPWWIRGLFQVFKHFNPLAVLRLSGPWGMSAITRMRPELVHKFDEIFDSEEEGGRIIPEYMFHCNAQTPTGESAFHSLMSGFAWAKEPMFERLDSLSPAVPLTAVYGGESWVSTISREDFVDKTNRADLPDSYTDVRVIGGAGHHVYADGHEEFNGVVLRACKLSDGRDRRGGGET